MTVARWTSLSPTQSPPAAGAARHPYDEYSQHLLSLGMPRAAAARKGLPDCSPDSLRTVARFPIYSRAASRFKPIVGFAQMFWS